MNYASVAVVGNGDIDWIKKDDVKHHSYIIGVDRAALVLLQRGIICDCAIGDFDSVSKEEFAFIKHQIVDVQRYPEDKDKTDLELGVEMALIHKPKEIVLYGGTGGRLDHELGALHLLQKILEASCKGILRDKYNEIQLVQEKCRLAKSPYFSYFSILPFTNEITVTIKGCKYPLQKHTMKRGMTLGISNVIVSAHADIVIHQGVACVVLSKDKE